MRAFELAETSIEGSERQMARLAGCLEHQAVGEPERGALAEVAEKHLDGRGLSRVVARNQADEQVCVNRAHGAHLFRRERIALDGRVCVPKLYPDR